MLSLRNMVMKILHALRMSSPLAAPPHGEIQVTADVRRDPEANLAPPVAEVISPLSSDPQPLGDDVLEFEVKGPSEDGDAEEYDKDDDLAAPLEPLSKEFIHENFQEANDGRTAVPSDLLEIDPSTFDTQGAIKKYGYVFNDPTDAPKRRALLAGPFSIGIKGATLKGSYADVDDMKNLLKGTILPCHSVRRAQRIPTDIYGFQDEEIMVLKDDNPESLWYPTRHVVFRHVLPKLVESDVRTVAGHGAQIEDLDGDEADGLDEDLVKARTPAGSPHLSVLDLQFNATFASGALDLPHSLGADTGGVKKHSDGEVVMWSACLDNADSHEILIDGGRYKGAMSHAFVQSIREYHASDSQGYDPMKSQDKHPNKAMGNFLNQS
ncbi:Ca(2+)-dependent cysteine protease, partial [Serendipita sp. 399]